MCKQWLFFAHTLVRAAAFFLKSLPKRIVPVRKKIFKLKVVFNI